MLSSKSRWPWGNSSPVGLSVEECIVNMIVCLTKLKVYVTALGTYDLIVGMDWMESHQYFIYCYEMKTIYINDKGKTIQIQGIKRKVSLCFILTIKMKCCLRKGFQIYVVEVVS
jgi:hypothetical protein